MPLNLNKKYLNNLILELEKALSKISVREGCLDNVDYLDTLDETDGLLPGFGENKKTTKDQQTRHDLDLYIGGRPLYPFLFDQLSDVKFHPNGATRFRSNGATLKRKFSGSDRVYYFPFLGSLSSCSSIGFGER